MKCTEFEEHINLLIDGELPQPLQTGLYAHLETCVECRALLDGILRLRQIVQKDQPPFPEALDGKLLSAVAHKEKTAAQESKRPLRIPLPIAAAAIIVVAVAAFFIGRTLKPETPTDQTSDSRPILVSVQPKIEILYALPSIEVVGYRSKAQILDSTSLHSQ